MVLGPRPGLDSNLELGLARRSRAALKRCADGCLPNRRADLLVLKDTGRHNQAVRATGTALIKMQNLSGQKRHILTRCRPIHCRLLSGLAVPLGLFWERCCTLILPTRSGYNGLREKPLNYLNCEMLGCAV
ncbi:MAG: hypothetical protein JWP25_1555 [Bradyrhizobium sp.]|nr:hypothetical protein [Bradyrhizobium sp.]